jgi:hypothetical protein
LLWNVHSKHKREATKKYDATSEILERERGL